MDYLGVITTITGTAAGVLGSVTARRYRLLRQNYGAAIAFVVVFLLGDTAGSYENIGIEILHGPAENAMSFRQAVTDECNMTAIAGAIMAQVAITALSLPNLGSTHWFVHGLFLLAVVSGCLAVYSTCLLQRIVAKLYHADQVKSWLRLPNLANDTKEADIQVSLPAVFIVGAPFNMVRISILSFLLGLGIYQGLVWTRSLDSSVRSGDSRHLFIMFAVTTGACVLFFTLTFSTKIVEGLLRIVRTNNGNGISNDQPNQKDDHDQQNWDYKQHAQFEVKTDVITLSRNIEPTTPLNDDTVPPHNVTDLVGALQYAARAHAESAKADRLVASEFAKLYPKG